MNETKVKILQCLRDGHWRTSSGIAQNCGLNLTNVSELLRRYRGQGLVNRERNYRVPRGYLYRITAIGVDRLRYLNSGIALRNSYVADDTSLIENEEQVFKSPLDLTSSSLADDIGLSGKERQDFQEWVKQKLGGV